MAILELDLRGWDRYTTPTPWFRSWRDDDGTVIIWRQDGICWAPLFRHFVAPAYENAVLLEHEHPDEGWALLAAQNAENVGRSSWREATITARADGFEEGWLDE